VAVSAQRQSARPTGRTGLMPQRAQAWTQLFDIRPAMISARPRDRQLAAQHREHIAAPEPKMRVRYSAAIKPCRIIETSNRSVF
jgi:hypothetical protein